MDYSYIYPLFGDEDTEQAKKFLIQDMIKYTPITALQSSEDGIEEVIPFSQVPQDIANSIISRIIENAYGVNTVLMANYAMVEEIFFSKIADHLLNYLKFRNIFAQIIYMEPGMITSRMLMMKALTDKNFRPISRWDPSERWISMDYGKDYSITNLLNPLNSRTHCHLVIKYDKPNSEFIKMLRAHNIGYYIDKLGKLVIKVLPAYNYNSIIKLIQLVHYYF